MNKLVGDIARYIRVHPEPYAIADIIEGIGGHEVVERKKHKGITRDTSDALIVGRELRRKFGLQSHRLRTKDGLKRLWAKPEYWAECLPLENWCRMARDETGDVIEFYTAEISTLEAEVDRLKAENKTLREALGDAADLI